MMYRRNWKWEETHTHISVTTAQDPFHRQLELFQTSSNQTPVVSSKMESLKMTPPNLNQTLSTQSPSLTITSKMGISILVLAFVLGFPGNLFVVWSVLCRVQRRSVTCLLVLNLAVADAFVLLSAPFFLRYLAGGRGWEFGAAMCKSVHYLCCINMYVSISLICLMSIDRCLAVTRPVLSQKLRKKRTLYVAMLGVWVMSFLLALPMLFYRSNLQPFRHKNKFEYFCIPYHWSKVGHEVFQYMMETVLGFLIPFTFIVLCYTSVICRLRSAMFHGRVKGSLLIFIIIITFAIFWLPYHMVNILQVIGLLQSKPLLNGTQTESPLYNMAKTARPTVTAFAFLSSSVNPILYVFAGSSYIRRAGFSFMAKLFEATQSDHSCHSGRRGTGPTETSTITKQSLKSCQSKSKVRTKSRPEEDTCSRDELKTLNTTQ